MSDINEMNEGLKWYVAHTYSGYENKVKANLEKIIENRGLGDVITDIRIPTETIVETDGDKKREVESKIFPAYILIKMVMKDETWHIVRNITGVTGFVGPGSKPVPLTDEEVASIIADETAETTRSTVEIGDMVEIVDGIFVGYKGKVSEIDDTNGECVVVISTVGRDMPTTLSLKSVKKAKED